MWWCGEWCRVQWGRSPGRAGRAVVCHCNAGGAQQSRAQCVVLEVVVEDGIGGAGVGGWRRCGGWSGRAFLRIGTLVHK